MADHRDTEKQKDPSGGKFSIKKIIALFISLLICGAVAYAAVIYLDSKKNVPDTHLAYVDLKPETVVFSFERLPGLYQALVDFNSEIALIDKEIERLNDIEKQFPQQTRIPRDEKKIWSRARKKLAAALNKLEKDIETLYVACLVNPEKGSEKIKRVKEELKKSADDVIRPVRELTCKLKPDPDISERDVIDKIKDRFFKLWT